MREWVRGIAHTGVRGALALATVALLLALGSPSGGATAPDPIAHVSDHPPVRQISLAPATPPVFPTPALGRLLVVVDHTPNQVFEHRVARSAAVALHHFARETSWVYVDDLTAASVREADVVVYFGLRASLPSTGWKTLRLARKLIVFDEHLAQLHDLGFFPNVTAASELAVPPHSRLLYRGQRFGVTAPTYTRFQTRAGARTYGTIQAAGGASPFAVIDGNAAFVAAPVRFDTEFRDPYGQGFLLAACDVLRIALDAPVRPRVALVRFEDVSVEVPTPRMRTIVDYMAARNLPYGIGVIPNQLIKGVQLSALREDPSLVETLRFGQAHGARIVLHGFHHSFNSPEDFEFWDAVHNRPLPQDSVEWMSWRLNAGLAIERSLGLHPVMWESPHYSASPLDYRVVAKFFATSWERRQPVAFLPWPIDRDEYGAALLPENLGYIAVGNDDPQHTLQMQLARARAFTVCGDCVPAAFLHPSTIEFSDLIDFVNGVEALGYRFVDPLSLVVPREDG